MVAFRGFLTCILAAVLCGIAGWHLLDKQSLPHFVLAKGAATNYSATHDLHLCRECGVSLLRGRRAQVSRWHELL